jgi:exodeoxyribonuclease-3
MHAHCDAILKGDRHPAVRFAAILYPGQTHALPDGIEAIGALPSEAEAWLSRVGAVLSAALSGAFVEATPQYSLVGAHYGIDMPIRLVVWNCSMALHSKVECLVSLRPDVAVIPECAEPDVIRKKAPDFEFANCEWTGTAKNKGLGIFSFNGVTLRRHQSWERSFHIFIPVEVRGREAANLLAVWAFNHRAKSVAGPTPKTTAEAIRHYQPFLTAAPAIVAGDFNANVKWDASGRYAKFAEVNSELESLGLTSAYHSTRGHALGEEPDPTLLFQKKPEKGYHIDYVYLPRTWLPRIRTVDVGSPAEWLSQNDHVPLVVDIAQPVTG